MGATGFLSLPSTPKFTVLAGRLGFSCSERVAACSALESRVVSVLASICEAAPALGSSGCSQCSTIKKKKRGSAFQMETGMDAQSSGITVPFRHTLGCQSPSHQDAVQLAAKM